MTGSSHRLIQLAGIIAAGLLSRTANTGLILLDKYLGDALYAAMVYTILRLSCTATVRKVAALTAVTMLVLELFQLTMIPARLLTSEHLPVRICARLLGTEFSFPDLLAYAVGILCIWLADRKTAGSRLRDPA